MTELLRVVGLDLSLTSTGMSDGHEHRVVQTSPDGSLEARLARIAYKVEHFVGLGATDLAVIEGGAFSRGTQSQAAEILSGLRLMIRVNLFELGIPFAMVTPTGLKLYTAGHGKATKAQMVQAIKDRHGIDLSQWKVSQGRYDVADSVGLAAMGYARLGQPLPTQGPPAPRASLNAVKWPTLPYGQPA